MWWIVAWLGPHRARNACPGPKSEEWAMVIGLMDQNIVQAVFPIAMGSMWAGLLEFRQQMWWIVALLVPIGPGIVVLAEQMCAWQWARS